MIRRSLRKVRRVAGLIFLGIGDALVPLEPQEVIAPEDDWRDSDGDERDALADELGA